MAESVLTEEVFRHIYANEPEMSHVVMAEKLGYDESIIRIYKRGKRMRLQTADNLLTALGLSHLLSDGTIKISSHGPNKGSYKLPLEARLKEERRLAENKGRRERRARRKELVKALDNPPSLS